MTPEIIAMASTFNKSIRVVSFNRKQAFTLLPQMKITTVKELCDYADTPMHDGFGDIVKDVVKFSEYSWEEIQEDRIDADFLFIHTIENTQLWNAAGDVIWKRNV